MSPFDTAPEAPAQADGPSTNGLIDPFGRRVDYLRLSVTDRCDFRCVYCMSERQAFLPKAEMLTLDEFDRLCAAFIGLGVRTIRLTGGEPLVRKGFMELVRRLSRHLSAGTLDDLTLTTNGSRLAEHARDLAAAGVRRINLSLDSLDPKTFQRITRGGDLDQVLEGLRAAQAAGLKVKINTVALKLDNAHDLPAMIDWAHGRNLDLTLIETMPLGEVDQDRTDQYLPLSQVRADLESFWTLQPLAERTAGPARYVWVKETAGRLGFITPLTHNFCEACNRVRVTCTGQLFMCLGQDDQADLRAPLRAHRGDDRPLVAAIRNAMTRKPKGHDFRIERRGAAPAIARPMSMTGG
jgi:cyclic pyranopterin phosphate synthase